MKSMIDWYTGKISQHEKAIVAAIIMQDDEEKAIHEKIIESYQELIKGRIDD